jgi:RNAse (barnase) inhibitor barstar
MSLQPGLVTIDSGSVDEVLEEATTSGATTYVLSVPPPADRAAFFDAVRTTFPLDPPLIGSRSWDALADSLWEGLRTLDAAPVVIVWRDAEIMSELHPDDYTITVAVLEDITATLSDANATVGSPKTVTVYIARPSAPKAATAE